jgi:hypothetical protein
MILGLGAAMVPSASASEWGVSVGVGQPAAVAAVAPVQTAPVVIEGRRTERVLLSPAHYERRYIESVYEYRTTRFGRTERFLVTPAHYEDVWVPAVYDTRCVVDPCETDVQVGVAIPFWRDHYEYRDRDRYEHRDHFEHHDRDEHVRR